MEAQLLRQVLEVQGQLYLKPGDRILFVLVGPYAEAPVERWFRDYSPNVVRIPAIEHPSQDYPLDESLLEGKTVGWLIVNVSISHAPSTCKMVERGMFIISNPGITSNWPAVLDPENRPICQAHASAILKAIGGDVSGRVHITHQDGTDLDLWVPEGNWEAEIGGRKNVGTNGLYGELYTAPYLAEGIYVLQPGDFLTNPINRLCSIVRLIIRGNKVTAATGDRDAIQLREILNGGKTPFRYMLGEFAIGLNPAILAQVYRSVVAEKLVGGIHIAIGTNSVCLKPECPDIGKFQHGRYNAGVHIDCIKFGTTVVFYPKTEPEKEVTILQGGVLMV